MSEESQDSTKVRASDDPTVEPAEESFAPEASTVDTAQADPVAGAEAAATTEVDSGTDSDAALPAAEAVPAIERDGAPASMEDAPAPVEAPASAAAPQAPSEAAVDAETAAAPDDTPATTGAAAASTDAGGAAAAPPAHKKTPPRAGAASLYRAFRSNRAIEGRVEKVIKGGYEIKVGRARGFCPHSQMDVQRIEDPDTHVGKSYRFRITQVRRGGADVVLSRRALLEEDRREEAKAVRATMIEGSIMQGHIAGTAPFGAFVDLGAGVMGLVHVSELSHTRVTDVASAVKVGETVQVKILKLDDKRGRVSLSRRQAEADPWADVAERFQPGQTYPGTIQRLADFGVFVELAPGVEALAPAAELPPSRSGWRDQLEVGSTRDWLVLSAEPRQRRISLTLPVEGSGADPQVPIAVGATVEGKVQRIERFGVFVWLGPGKIGLMPNMATGTRPGTDLARQFPVADSVKVVVTEVSEDEKRIRLAVEGHKPKPRSREGERTDDFSQRAKGRRTHEAQTLVQDPGTSFGTSLADKLKAALNGLDS